MRRAIAALLLLAGCAAVYVLNRRGVNAEITPRPLLYLVADTEREMERIPLELTRVSEKMENEIGEELARSYGLTGRQNKDAEGQQMEAYLDRVGRALTLTVRRKGIHYRFFYDTSNHFVNAAALPGGQIVFGRGLLRLLESEDELAAILGHEIAHVDERHAIERLQYELKSRELGLGGVYRLGALGVMLFEAGYTKEQELEADRVGLRFAVAAGYSPGGALDALQRLARLHSAAQHPAASPVEELAGVPLQALQEYFRSHPPEQERIATLEADIAAHHWNQTQARRPLLVRAVFLADAAAELDRRGLFDRAISKYKEAITADANYLPAREGLVRATWRSGDAQAAVSAAQESLAQKPDNLAMWKMLAQALAAADRKNAPQRFLELYGQLKPNPDQSGRKVIQTELHGLELLAGRAEALESYRKDLAGISVPATEAALRRRMAWWMIRAGKLGEAEKELDAVRQRLPQQTQIYFDLAWVLTDLGRQADAEEMLSRARGESERGDALAIRAVINWRTEQRDAAKTSFQSATQEDPVWLQPHWAVQNYSAAAAAVLEQLRAVELARRKQEDLRAGRR